MKSFIADERVTSNFVDVRLGINHQYTLATLNAYTKNTSSTSTFYALQSLVPVNGLNISFPSIPTTIKCASTSANDTLAGTGARILYVTGLNSNFEPIADTIFMNGTSVASTTVLFYRISGVTVVSVGSAGGNVGEIYFGETFVSSKPTTALYGCIDIDTNAMYCPFYTVPHNKISTPISVNAATDANANTGTNYRFVIWINGIRYANNPVFINTGVQVLSVDFIGAFSTGTDILMETKAVSGTPSTSVYVGFIERKV